MLVWEGDQKHLPSFIIQTRGSGESSSESGMYGRQAESAVDDRAWAVHWPVPWTACASGKSADFPGLIGNPLPLVRFYWKDRFSTPLVEKRPAPPAPWPERFNFIFLKKIFTYNFCVIHDAQ